MSAVDSHRTGDFGLFHWRSHEEVAGVWWSHVVEDCRLFVLDTTSSVYGHWVAEVAIRCSMYHSRHELRCRNCSSLQLIELVDEPLCHG
jgi:hypothetical protein